MTNPRPQFSCAKRTILRAAMLLLLCSSVLLQPAFANIVLNPGFETGDFTSWSTSGNDGEFVDVDDLDPNSGEYAAYFGPQGAPAFLTQTLVTIPGAVYDLSFFLQNTLPGTNFFSVAWNGVELDLLQDAGAFPYQQFVYEGLVASSDTTVLQFGFSNEDGFWDFDDVSAQLVPEPASFALVGLGVAVVLALRRRAAMQR